ncbi:MAG: methyl-accepting chemotaxis protein [Spirochaetales bacterium]|nr:methyl-accepting chemotaxis protein [Spirochaetales bacterium]
MNTPKLNHSINKSEILSKLEKISAKSFLRQMLLTTILTYLVVSGVSTLIDLLMFNAMTGSVTFIGFIWYFLSSLILTFIPISVLSVILVTLLVRPIMRLMVKKELGKNVTQEEFFAARNRTDGLPSIMLAISIGIPILMSIIKYFTGGALEHEGILGTIKTVSIFMLGAQAQNSIYQQLLMKPRAILKTYTIEKDHSNWYAEHHDRIGLFISAFFVFAVLLYSSVTVIDAIIDCSPTNTATDKSILENDSLAGMRKHMINDFSKDGSVNEEDFQMNIEKFSERIFEMYFLLFLIMAGFVSCAEFLTHRSKHVQVKILQDILTKLAEGSGDLTHRVVIVQANDTGILAYKLNLLLDKLQTMFRNITDQTRLVSESSEQVTKVLEENVAATEEMAASVTQINSNTIKNQQIINASEDALNQMLHSLDDITSQVNTQAAYVEQTSSAMTEMITNIQSVEHVTSKANDLSEKLSKVSTEGGSAVKNSIEAVKDIEESSNTVNNLIKIISKILSETNMLAMNAAIEAAHAGDAGRGFAVVAEEVRNLADNSSKNLKIISANIKDVIEKVGHGVSLSETAGNALNEVSDRTEETTRLMSEIALAMKEQAAGANEVLKSVHSLVDASNSINRLSEDQQKNNTIMKDNLKQTVNAFSEVQSATSELEEGNKEILRGIDNLKEVIARNNDVVAMLQKEIEGFKI